MTDRQHLERAWGSLRCLCEGQTVKAVNTGTFLTKGYLYNLAVVRASNVECWLAFLDNPDRYAISGEDIMTAPFDQDRQSAEIKIPYTDGFTLDGIYEIFAWGPEHPQGLPPYLLEISIGPKRNFERFKFSVKRWGRDWGTIAAVLVGLVTLITVVVSQ